MGSIWGVVAWGISGDSGCELRVAGYTDYLNHLKEDDKYILFNASKTQVRQKERRIKHSL